MKSSSLRSAGSSSVSTANPRVSRPCTTTCSTSESRASACASAREMRAVMPGASRPVKVRINSPTALPQATCDPQARHFRAAAGISSRHCGQLLVAGAAAGFSMNALMSRNTTRATTKKSMMRPNRSPYLMAFCPESTIWALRHSPPGSTRPTIGITRSSTMPDTTLPTAAPITTPTASANAFCLRRNSRNSFVVSFIIRPRSHAAARQASRCCEVQPCVLSPARMDRPQISVVIPLFNEAESVRPLLDELFGELAKLGRSYEVICVDDGSRDGTFAELARLAAQRRELRVIRFRLNFGQTAAMSAGIEAARGDVIVPMDGDLQNDPADIGKLLAQLDSGYDVVSGWRRNRQDREFGRKLPSRIANRLISSISGVRLHDYGCSLKAYRRDVLRDVKLYGEMHRFIPIYASWQGARVTEMVVNHRARHAGVSKYGLSRTLKVVLDLMVVKFLASYATKPIYVFGGFGLASIFTAFFAVSWAVYYKVMGLKSFVETPLPLLAVMLTLVGVLSLLMGLMAELQVRTYYESQGKRPYLVAEELNEPEEASVEHLERHARAGRRA